MFLMVKENFDHLWKNSNMMESGKTESLKVRENITGVMENIYIKDILKMDWKMVMVNYFMTVAIIFKVNGNKVKNRAHSNTKENKHL